MSLNACQSTSVSELAAQVLGPYWAAVYDCKEAYMAIS